MGTGRELKKQLLRILKDDDFIEKFERFRTVPERRIINPLFTLFFHREELVRWRAVTLTGIVVANLADKDMESARVVMRRLMWALNDESGGIGWGAPEAMGEILARHEGLALEFGRILISYIQEDKNHIELETLQRGVLWGILRFAESRPELAVDASSYLSPYLESDDPIIRGLAAGILSFLETKKPVSALKDLSEDMTRIPLYRDGTLSTCTVGELARKAVNKKPGF